MRHGNRRTHMLNQINCNTVTLAIESKRNEGKLATICELNAGIARERKHNDKKAKFFERIDFGRRLVGFSLDPLIVGGIKNSIRFNLRG